MNRRAALVGLGLVVVMAVLALSLQFQRTEKQAATIAVYGSWGSAPGQLGLAKARNGGLAGPGGLAVLPDGSICVADTQNARVQCWRSDTWEVVWKGAPGEAPSFLATGSDGTLWGATTGGVVYVYRDGANDTVATLNPASLPGLPDIGKVERLQLEGLGLVADGKPVADLVVLGRAGSYRACVLLMDRAPARTLFSVYQPARGDGARTPPGLGPGAVGSWAVQAGTLYVETRSGEGFGRTVFALSGQNLAGSFTVNFPEGLRGFRIVGGWPGGVYTLTWDQGPVYQVSKITTAGHRVWDAVVARPGEKVWAAAADPRGSTVAVLTGNENGWQIVLLRSETKWRLHLRGRQ